ncbi:MAG TPA: hypothetical protein VFN71_05065 [Methylomirabilota bacterium]|nr:hypothetical protein [Methylomirabilota bacterium]
MTPVIHGTGKRALGAGRQLRTACLPLCHAGLLELGYLMVPWCSDASLVTPTASTLIRAFPEPIGA